MLRALLRSWRRSRLLTAQFVITVAIGMGAAVALVSLMLALGYQPLPFRDPGRLVAVWEHVESGTSIMAISGPDAADFEQASHSILFSWRFRHSGILAGGARRCDTDSGLSHRSARLQRPRHSPRFRTSRSPR